MILRCTTLAFAAVASAAAQTETVFPSDHAPTQAGQTHTPGFSWQTTFPFSAGVARQMALYESFDLDIPDGRQITHVGFPRDEARTSFGEQIQLEILMGRTTRTVATVDSEFAKNYAAAPQVVFTRKIFALPDLGIVSNPPVTDTVWVPLDTPFTHDAAQNLIVEYRVYANSKSNQAFSYFLDFGQFHSPITAHGQACPTSSGLLPKLESQRTAIGGTWRVALTNATASSSGTLFIGLGLLPTPLPIPQTNCLFYVNGLVGVPFATNSGGSNFFTFPVPDDRGLVGGRLFSQALVQDLFANPLGITMSNADEMQLGLEPLLAIVTARGDALAQRGSVSRNNGAISLFRHQ